MGCVLSVPREIITPEMEELSKSIQGDARVEFDAWADATEGRLTEPQDPTELEAELAAQKELQCEQLAPKLGFLPSPQVAEGRQGLAVHIEQRTTQMAQANKEAWDFKMLERSQRLQAEARAKVDAWVARAEEAYTELRDPKELQTELAATQKNLHCEQLATDLKFMPRVHVVQACRVLALYIDQRLANLVNTNKEAWDVKMAEKSAGIQTTARMLFEDWAATVARRLMEEPQKPEDLESELAAQTKSHCAQLAANLAFMPHAHVEEACGQHSTYMDQRATTMAEANKVAWELKMEENAAMARQLLNQAFAAFHAFAEAAENDLRTEPRDPAGVARWLAEQQELHCQKLAANLAFLPPVEIAKYGQDLATYIDERIVKLGKANRDALRSKSFYNGVRNVAGGDSAEAPKSIASQDSAAAPHGGGSPFSSPSQPAASSGFHRDAHGWWHDSKTGHFATKEAVTAAGLSWL